jgi:translocation and assembly module TamA
LRLQLDLGDSGYYRRVEVQSSRKEAVDYRIPVTIKTVPAKPRLYAWGLGYGTDTGPRISLGAVYRRINDRGHGILADARVSRVYRTVGLQYRVPIGNLVSDSLVYKASADFEDVGDEGNTDLYTLGISHNVEWGPFQRRLYAEFRYEDYELGEGSEVTRNLIPGITLSQLRTDNVLFPRQGYSWSADLRGAAGVISDTRFLRGRLDGRYVYPVGERGRVLLRSRLGATAVKDFDKLPASERFFAGGDQSVRGYGYQKLGPRDDSGDIVGGRYLAVGSVELDYLFAGDFGAALFVDSGNADDNFLPSLKTGAGVGLRWRSPVGMLRVDVAHPFVDSDDSYRLHISIGPEL